MSLINDLMVLTKFRINALAVFTGYAAVVVHGAHATDWSILLPVMLALLFTGGCANTLNQVFEVRKDALMYRTRKRRPLPDGRISIRVAWFIAMSQLLAAVAIQLFMFNSWLAVAGTVFTILYYSFFYTLFLKPRHHLNIVIGGVPGAMGPIIAWSMITGNLAAWEPWFMFALVFLWTPPHAWALAIKLREDYARANIPMLPVVKGVDETTRQIFFYTIVLVAASLAGPLLSDSLRAGPIYISLAVAGGLIFLAWTWRLWKHRPVIPTMPLFTYTLLYISALFAGLVADALIFVKVPVL
ncbi:MAG: protoheme IX farnesyltransferase [Planctomycetota bacterium]|nr:MAG: protoheme IX farnesyltransferase [Planctomycetota bacterium]